MIASNIFDFAKQELSKYQNPTEVVSGWDWSMQEHIKTSILYKNGRLLTGNIDDKPVKNIILPILNLEYRAEDIDVKDINLYVEDEDKNHLSFLINKYHDDVFVTENNVDDFIDEEKEESIDLGAVLVKDIGEALPEIVHLQDIAFCNQNDILSSPFGILHIFSIDELKEMEKRGWGNRENGATHTIDELITLAMSDSENLTSSDIEVYEIHGTLPKYYLNDANDISEEREYIKSLYVIAFYKDDAGDQKGIVLFRKEQKQKIFKLCKRDKIHNRAVGRGGIEELFEDQVWTNYGQINKKNLLDAASKTILQTDDDTLKAKHPTGLRGMKNLEIVQVQEGAKIGRIDNYPLNIALFDKWNEELEIHARSTGAAQEGISGDQPNSGTPFRSLERQTMSSQSLHDYRIGKHAKFLEELYRDWFIPYIIKQITGGVKWLSTLDLDDMQEVSKNIIKRQVNKLVVDKILAGEQISEEEIAEFKDKATKEFMENKKRFLEILKDELKGASVAVKINISGKQKDLSLWTDKLVNIFRQIIGSVNPQTGESILSQPSFAKLFNQIISASGMEPLDFAEFTSAPSQQALPQQLQTNTVSQAEQIK